jgi:hypothetical protein
MQHNRLSEIALAWACLLHFPCKCSGAALQHDGLDQQRMPAPFCCIFPVLYSYRIATFQLRASPLSHSFVRTRAGPPRRRSPPGPHIAEVRARSIASDVRTEAPPRGVSGRGLGTLRGDARAAALV